MEKYDEAKMELEQAVVMESVEAFVLEVLRDKNQVEGNYPERWNLSYKNFLYQNGELQCYELKFEWKRLLSKFILPTKKMIIESGLVKSWLRGVEKKEVFIRAKLKKDVLVFDIEFIPHYKHLGKLHNDLSLSEALEVIGRHRL